MKRLLLLAALPACAPEGPAAPAWGAHVKPILEASCAGCHGAPPLGGAPAGFRLDVFSSRDGDGGGEPVQGAQAMREFALLRAADGHGDLLDHQVDTLAAWDGSAGEPRAGNRAPVFRLLDPAAPPPIRDAVLLDYELRDPDFEMVDGELRVGPRLADAVVVDRSLHAGRGRAGFSTGSFPDDEVRVWAAYSDGSDAWATDLGWMSTGHDGDIAPRVAITSPRPGAILADRDVTTIFFRVTDVDSPGPFTADLRAVPDPSDPAGAVTVATGIPVPADGAAVVWDTTGLAAGDTWQLTINVSDGAGSGGGTSMGGLIVSHATTTETFASLGDVFAKCTGCHDGSRGDAIDLRAYAGGVYPARDLVYRRAIVARDMPPPSALLDGGLPLSDGERDRLAGWLLAGAPE